ncbi:hypothetical protein LCGC14_2158650 [marine sediment metagenome]|uniref:Uncharacterized protein n=1 Tax=marine sediment metagenome TaxID=412755 RepID=A0A0F9DTA8_9ZZZZ
MSHKQFLAVLITLGLTALGMAGQTVLLVREINTSLAHIEKTQDRILDRLEAIEKHVDWTDHE